MGVVIAVHKKLAARKGQLTVYKRDSYFYNYNYSQLINRRVPSFGSVNGWSLEASIQQTVYPLPVPGDTPTLKSSL